MESTALRTLSDSELIHCSIQGHEGAFAEIIRRNRQCLRLTARRCAQYDCDVDDILQDALLRAHRYLGQFRGECAIHTWLKRLVAHAAYDHRTRVRKREYPFLDHPELGAGLTLTLVSNPFESIDVAITVRTALQSLPVEYRRAVELVDIQGMSVEAAARELAVAPGTIKSRRARARAMLRHVLAEGSGGAE